MAAIGFLFLSDEFAPTKFLTHENIEIDAISLLNVYRVYTQLETLE